MNDSQKDNSFNKDLKKDNTLSDLRRNTELFHGDQDLYIIYKRVQNLVSALFLVTSSLSDTEELKKSLRTSGLKSLSQAVAIVEYQTIDQGILRRLVGPILEMNSLLGISFWAGIISEMNNLILQKEIIKLEKDIHQIIDKYKNRFLISSAIFKDVEDMDLHRKFSINQSQEVAASKGHYIRQNLKDSIKDNRKDSKVQDSRESASPNRLNRRETILKLLAEKGNLGVRDFSSVISELSEKTIQRELLALVAEGIIKKQGERRWSTYSLP